MHYSNAKCLQMTMIFMHMTVPIIFQKRTFKHFIFHCERTLLKHILPAYTVEAKLSAHVLMPKLSNYVT